MGSWIGMAVAIAAGLAFSAVFYLRTTPEQRRLQRERTTRIETSRSWRRGLLMMAPGPLVVLIVGLITTGVALDIALGLGFVLIAVGMIFMIRAMRSEPKIRPSVRAR